jgi:hypothetical protein
VFAKKKAPRSCEKGHPLEESWERCPHCEAERASGHTSPAESPASEGGEETGTTRERVREGRDVSRRPVIVEKPAARSGLPGGWLVAVGGEQAGQDFRLTRGRNVLGKSAQCDVVLKDALASDRHAVLEIREGGEAVLEDLGSRHGTFADGGRVEGRCVLKDGERVRVGGTELVYRSFPD